VNCSAVADIEGEKYPCNRFEIVHGTPDQKNSVNSFKRIRRKKIVAHIFLYKKDHLSSEIRQKRAVTIIISDNAEVIQAYDSVLMSVKASKTSQHGFEAIIEALPEQLSIQKKQI